MMIRISSDEAAVGRERELIAAARRDCTELAGAGLSALPPADLVPGYTVVREIGRGGMGIVYEAEQKAPRRAVALKMIGVGGFVDEHRVMLFKREVQSLARLRHPAIAAIYEAGRTSNGRHFFVMELVRGVPLTEYVRLMQLPLRAQLQLFRRVCEAVHHAHQRGVIHRDLKPANILIDTEGNPKILDFGLARIGDSDGAVSTASVEVGKIMGTLPYMSPEQARVTADEVPAEIDVRSDVYSLGVVLYELITGQLPYDLRKVTAPEALWIISQKVPRKPSTINRALRGDLETIAVKALAKRPSRRYDSVAALAEDIDRHLTSRPIRARPPSAPYLLRKWIARHQAAFTLLVVMFAIVSAFAVMLRIQSTRIARAQASIEAAKQPTTQPSGWVVATVAHRLEGLARSRMGQGDYAAAEEVLRACRDIRRNFLGQAHGLTAYTESLLGECLTALRRFDEAEPLLRRSCLILAEDRGASHNRRLEAMQCLIALYEAWGKPELAAQWRAKLPATRPSPPEKRPPSGGD